MTLSTADTDQVLHVLEQLGAEPALRAVEMGVAVHDGVATLFGTVDSAEQKLAAERAVLRVPGILAVVVTPVETGPQPHPRTDTDIAHAVVECLRRECAPPCAVRVHVEDASVTLKGEVDLFHQRDALDRAIRTLPGVKSVINRLSVRPPESQADIHAKVQSAVIRELASLDPEHAAGHRPGEMEQAMTSGGKILIIDDDDDFRASLRPVLEDAGYTVFEGKSGREGLQKLIEHDPDAIVLDVMMETGEEGYGVTEAIKYEDEYQRYRSTPIVMVSSIHESPEERFPRSEELGMILPDAYLTKPLDLDRFLAVVQRALARRGRT
jgi:CheY-like chemotaxis protein/osmotically-inducible protein OsmY